MINEMSPHRFFESTISTCTVAHMKKLALLYNIRRKQGGQMIIRCHDSKYSSMRRSLELRKPANFNVGSCRSFESSEFDVSEVRAYGCSVRDCREYSRPDLKGPYSKYGTEPVCNYIIETTLLGFHPL